ncbi:MAG: rhodanese-like domain-containing protein [Candidatus Limnocylindrales bacterium]
MTTQSHAGTGSRPTISTSGLAEALTDPHVTVVDIRSLAAYNGWRLDGEARGGHLPGARAFPDAWRSTVDEVELGRLLTDKAIEPERTVIVYGGDRADAAAFQAWLLDRGLTDVLVYEPGFAAWAADESLPVERLPRFERLVYPDWVRQLVDGESPETYEGNGFVVLHVNFGVPEEYAVGHLPGAVYLDTNWLEDPITWNRRSPAEIEATLLRLGIAPDTTVVVYGRDTVGDANEKWPGRRAGQIAATRAALILRYAGVTDVRLLDGGYDRWIGAGHPIDTVPYEPRPIAAFGKAIPERPEFIVDIDEAKAMIADPSGAALVSVRTWNEHIGQVSGYNYIGPAGRIAGDVWGNCGTDAYHMQHYRNPDNTMRAYPEITANWDDAGITPDKRVAFYCGTGWRASETWFYADLMAWPRIAVYDGGWFEWSQDPINNPIEVGEPAGADAAA